MKIRCKGGFAGCKNHCNDSIVITEEIRMYFITDQPLSDYDKKITESI